MQYNLKVRFKRSNSADLGKIPMRNTESDPYLFLGESILFSLTTQNFLLVSC